MRVTTNTIWRKRLRKKLKNKMGKKAVFDVSLEFGGTLPGKASNAYRGTVQ